MGDVMVFGQTLPQRILALVQWQPAVAILVGAAFAWVTNLVLRSRWSQSRLKLLHNQFRKLRDAIGVGILLLSLVELLRRSSMPEWVVATTGFLALFAWLVIALRVARVLVLEWLFAHSTNEGVPLLLVDLFSIAAALIALGALLHTVFLIEVTSLLATSALASVVLGLALQDTLGHLLAGISLQLDRPFRLGEWVEIRLGSERVSGQVLEVSWRATLLLALGEELVTVPNKMVAQGLVLNFSGRERPFVRSHLFRVPLNAPLAVVKEVLVEAARETKGIASDPAPVPLVMETTESWIAVKMVTFITDYGSQFTIGDAFHARALKLLADRGIELASNRLLVAPGISPRALDP